MPYPLLLTEKKTLSEKKKKKLIETIMNSATESIPVHSVEIRDSYHEWNKQIYWQIYIYSNKHIYISDWNKQARDNAVLE